MADPTPEQWLRAANADIAGAVKAERERCAKVCRRLARIQREWAKGVPEFKREHGRAAAQLEIAAQEIERGEG